MRVQYKDRQIGAIYYCMGITGRNEYIFQYTEKGHSCYPNVDPKKEDKYIDKSSCFGPDWRNNSDKELRLATTEEIQIFLAACKNSNHIPLPLNTPSYEIY